MSDNEKFPIQQIYRKIDNQVNQIKGELYKEINQLRSDNSSSLENVYIKLTEISQTLEHLNEKIDEQKKEDSEIHKKISNKNKNTHKTIENLENNVDKQLSEIQKNLSDRVSNIESEKVPNLENEVGNIKTKLNIIVVLIVKIFLLLVGWITDVFAVTNLLIALAYLSFC